jgi:geranylgeranyl diphosphate synthase, type III
MSDSSKAPLLPHTPDPALLEAFRYIDEMPGKNVRGTLIDCFQLWMKVESPDVLNCIKVREK